MASAFSRQPDARCRLSSYCLRERNSAELVCPGGKKHCCKSPYSSGDGKSLRSNVRNAIAFRIAAADPRRPGEIGSERINGTQTGAFPDQHHDCTGV